MNQPAIRVLIVDDEAAIRRALRPPLVELGFQVHEASRGEEALQLLHSSPVDVVLLDINMPGIGGIETLRRIRAFAPRLPVLMVTVRDGEEEKVEALELGADDYITKPFSIRELIARIRTAHRRVHAPARAEDAPIEIGEIRLDAGTSQRHQARPARPPHAQGIRHSVLPDEPRRPRDHLRPACSRRSGAPIAAKRSSICAPSSASCARRLRTTLPTPLYLLTDVYVGYRFADAQMLQENSEAEPRRPLLETEPDGALQERCRVERTAEMRC